MIQLENLGDLLEPFLELRDLLEMVAEFDNGSCLEHPLLVDDKLTML